jgi:hypothetical protein
LKGFNPRLLICEKAESYIDLIQSIYHRYAGSVSNALESPSTEIHIQLNFLQIQSTKIQRQIN